jgi:hypothetical protein
MPDMDDHEMEKALKALSRERISAPDNLVQVTKDAVHRRRILPVAIMLSLGIVSLCSLAVVLVFIFLDIDWIIKLYGVLSLLALLGAVDLVIVAARRRVVPFCRKIESLTGYGIKGERHEHTFFAF